MKTLLLLVLAAPAIALAAPDDVLPAAYPASRYEKFAQHSPFSPPTAAAPAPPSAPVVKPPGWADSLSIAGAVQNGGYSLVTIVDKDSNERFSASTDPLVTNTRDVALTSVQWSDQPDQTQVTLRRGTEFAVVKFDAAAAKAQPVNPMLPKPANPLNRAAFPPPPGNPAGAATPNPAGAVRRNQIIRAAPTPLPHVNANPPRPGVKLPGADDDDDDD